MSLNNDQDQEKKIKDYTVFKIHQKKSHLNIHSFCIVFKTRRKNWQRLDVESRLFSMIFSLSNFLHLWYNLRGRKSI